MATFVSTTLTKRTGDTTTVFLPGVINSGIGTLFEASTLAGLGSSVSLMSRRSAITRHTGMTIRVPMLTDDELSVLRFAQAKLELIVPDGMLQTQVDDLVGYVNAATASGLSNLNKIFVVGEGVY